MSKTWNWLKKEFREILPVWAFFACAFALLSFTLSAMLGRYHVALARPHEYLIASLIMAKVVPTVDALMKLDALRVHGEFLKLGSFCGIRFLCYRNVKEIG